MNTLRLGLLLVLCSIDAPRVGAAGNNDDKTRTELDRAIFNEAKQERLDEAQRARSKLQELQERINSERRPYMREDIVDDLGKTDDPRSIPPLLKILHDKTESAMVRIRATEALHRLHCPLTTNGVLDAKMRQKVSVEVKDVYQAEQDDQMRCYLAALLYEIGQKDVGKPQLLRCLRDGKEWTLNVFQYYHKEGEVLVQVTFPGANEKRKVDLEAAPILRVAVGEDYPEPIRIGAARLLAMIGDKALSLQTCIALLSSGKDFRSRMTALDVLGDIGGEQARKAIEEATKIDKLRPHAKQVLKSKWPK